MKKTVMADRWRWTKNDERTFDSEYTEFVDSGAAPIEIKADRYLAHSRAAAVAIVQLWEWSQAMGNRFVNPDTARLEISDGDWLLVKRRLSTGETREAYQRITKRQVGDQMELDELEAGMALVTAYLLDWSLVDHDGKSVVIRGLLPRALESVLDNLDPQSFMEMLKAIQAHDAAMTKEREREREGPFGGSGSPPTSPSAA
jgi:hypothetical protein